MLSANDDLGASVEVTNTGRTAGDVIVQMYLSRPGVDGASVRSLVGMQRLSLNPGENKSVSIQVPNRNLSVVTSDGTRKIVPGELQIWVGDGQPVARAGLAKAAGLLDRSPSRAVRFFRSEDPSSEIPGPRKNSLTNTSAQSSGSPTTRMDVSTIRLPGSI